MNRSRFIEDQIIVMLKEQKAGLPTAKACRKHFNEPTDSPLNWKKD